MRTEAELLNLIESAPTLEEQRRYVAELMRFRKERTAAVEAERQLDLANAYIRDITTPASVHELHTASTDWLGEVAASSGDYNAEIRAKATLWFKNLHPAVKADRDEFSEQAMGMARRESGRFGEHAEAAYDTFLRHVGHLYKKAQDEFPPGEVDVEQSGNAESTVTDYDTEGSDPEPMFAEDFDGEDDTGSQIGSGVHPEMPGASGSDLEPETFDNLSTAESRRKTAASDDTWAVDAWLANDESHYRATLGMDATRLEAYVRENEASLRAAFPWFESFDNVDWAEVAESVNEGVEAKRATRKTASTAHTLADPNVWKQLEALPRIGATDGQKGDRPAVKLFDPYGSAWWVLWEYDPSSKEAFGYAELFPGGGELGYVSVAELAELPFMGQKGLRIEQDSGVTTMVEGFKSRGATPPGFLMTGAKHSYRKREREGLIAQEQSSGIFFKKTARLETCRNCGATIDTSLGAETPTGEYHEGTSDDPRPPGETDDICDICEYGGQVWANWRKAARQTTAAFGVYDEWFNEGRLIAGPFETREEAAAAMRQVDYPFTFSEGPETVVGDPYIHTASRKTAEKYRAEVAGVGEDTWSSNALEYDTPEEAKAWLTGLSGRWFGYDMSRVVPVSTPKNEPVDPSDPAIFQNFRSGSRKQTLRKRKATRKTAFTVRDIARLLLREDHLGWGYASSHGLTLEQKEALDEAVAQVATELGLSEDDFFMWLNSRPARWLLDAATMGGDPVATVKKYLNASEIADLRAEGRAKRKQASTRKTAEHDDTFAVRAWLANSEQHYRATLGMDASQLESYSRQNESSLRDAFPWFGSFDNVDWASVAEDVNEGFEAKRKKTAAYGRTWQGVDSSGTKYSIVIEQTEWGYAAFLLVGNQVVRRIEGGTEGPFNDFMTSDEARNAALQVIADEGLTTTHDWYDAIESLMLRSQKEQRVSRKTAIAYGDCDACGRRKISLPFEAENPEGSYRICAICATGYADYLSWSHYLDELVEDGRVDVLQDEVDALNAEILSGSYPHPTLDSAQISRDMAEDALRRAKERVTASRMGSKRKARA